MSTNTARGLAVDTLNDNAVAEYLQRVPDFFERNSQLLDKLRLPHVRAGGATVSLVERQVEVLRDRRLWRGGRGPPLWSAGCGSRGLVEGRQGLGVLARGPGAFVAHRTRSDGFFGHGRGLTRSIQMQLLEGE